MAEHFDLDQLSELLETMEPEEIRRSFSEELAQNPLCEEMLVQFEQMDVSFAALKADTAAMPVFPRPEPIPVDPNVVPFLTRPNAGPVPESRYRPLRLVLPLAAALLLGLLLNSDQLFRNKSVASLDQNEASRAVPLPAPSVEILAEDQSVTEAEARSTSEPAADDSMTGAAGPELDQARLGGFSEKESLQDRQLNEPQPKVTPEAAPELLKQVQDGGLAEGKLKKAPKSESTYQEPPLAEEHYVAPGVPVPEARKPLASEAVADTSQELDRAPLKADRADKETSAKVADFSAKTAVALDAPSPQVSKDSAAQPEPRPGNVDADLERKIRNLAATKNNEARSEPQAATSSAQASNNATEPTSAGRAAPMSPAEADPKKVLEEGMVVTQPLRTSSKPSDTEKDQARAWVKLYDSMRKGDALSDRRLFRVDAVISRDFTGEDDLLPLPKLELVRFIADQKAWEIAWPKSENRRSGRGQLYLDEEGICIRID